MLTVKIWCPDTGSVDDAKEVEIASELTLDCAVETYAKRDWSNSDYWESSVFHAEVDGKVRRFVVRAEQTVDFNVKELHK